MQKYHDISTFIAEDVRFKKNSTIARAQFASISEVFGREDILRWVCKDLDSVKYAAKFLNLLLFSAAQNDSFICEDFTPDRVLDILSSGHLEELYQDISDLDLRRRLDSAYISLRDVVELLEASGYSISEVVEDEIVESNQSSTQVADFWITKSFADEDFNITANSESPNSTAIDFSNIDSDEYWARAVSLDFPMWPNVNFEDEVSAFSHNGVEYRLYGEAHVPEVQSQISAVSDVLKFSSEQILNLFPTVRLYTRSPYMYKQYDGLEFDDDLGVIFPISGYTKRQIRKNIIEYPYVTGFDRIVKRDGRETTIPFWKHIEIDGEIMSTLSVWDKLKDTKKLPRTESFATEYVVRKYLLDRDYNRVEHKYPMRGTVNPFIVLYNSPEYYRRHKLDPQEVGRQCVQSRIDYFRSVNPIIKLHRELSESVA